MDVALDKTVQEFKMWGSMTRRPGQPADYLRQLYTTALTEQRLGANAPGKPALCQGILQAKESRQPPARVPQAELLFGKRKRGSASQQDRKFLIKPGSKQRCACF